VRPRKRVLFTQASGLPVTVPVIPIKWGRQVESMILTRCPIGQIFIVSKTFKCTDPSLPRA
jgi:hypothetical protein